VIAQTGAFKNGLKDGSFKEYNESGILRLEYTYKMGEANGKGKEYDKFGRFKSYIIFKEDLLDNET